MKVIFLYLYIQVPVTDLQSRYAHSRMCCCIYFEPGIAEVVLFGQCTTSPPKIESFIAETTVLKCVKYILCMTQLIKALV